MRAEAAGAVQVIVAFMFPFPRVLDTIGKWGACISCGSVGGVLRISLSILDAPVSLPTGRAAVQSFSGVVVARCPKL